MTIVIHLPQSVDKITQLLSVIASEWPDAKFQDADGFTRLEIAPMDEKGGY